MSAVLAAEGLTFALGARRILDGVGLELAEAEIVCLAGASGAGKSTLLRILAGLQRPDRGTLWLGGAQVEALSMPGAPATAAGPSPRAYRRQVAFVAQRPAMAPGTVADNLALGPRFQQRQLLPEAGEELLNQAGLDETFGAREAARLSLGEQLRVALARALALAPRVLLLDEPTAALDSATAEGLLSLLRNLAKLGMAIGVVTHDLRAPEQLRARRLTLRDGRLG